MRRVLLINRVAFLGGVERVLLTLATGLRECCWEPLLACPDQGALAEAALEAGVGLIPCPFDRMRITANPLILVRYPAAWLRGARAIKQYCRENAVNLIHAHHPVTALYAIPALRELGIPLVLHVHETLPARPLYQAALRIAIRYAAIVLCVSGAARHLAISMGADATRAHVVFNGIDPQFFNATATTVKPALVESAGPGPHVGVFAVLEPRKAQHIFLEAAAALVGKVPEARFWLVGPAALADKMSYADRLKQMIEASPLRGRAFLVGFQPDARAWLSAMDVIVQPSVALESFGMALAEAQALGRPVIASRIGGMPEVVSEGVTGLVVPPGNATALAAAMLTLLEDPERRAAFGNRGMAKARHRFAPDAFRRAVAEFYDLAIESNRPRSTDRCELV
jgi:glycosyltransferase involved in cell wall biosynthesis